MLRNSHPSLMYVATLTLLLLTAPLLKAQATKPPAAASPQNLTCSPAPCVFPNVRVSNGKYTISTNAITANPNNPSQLLIAAYDNNCNFSRQAFFTSNDGGTTWSLACVGTIDGAGNPIVGYDLNNLAYAGGIKDGTSVYIGFSSDNGVHWSGARQIIGDSQGVVSAWLQVDTGINSPLQNSLYVSYVHFPVYSGLDTQIRVAHSNDGGSTWVTTPVDEKQHYPSLVDQFSHVSIGDDGNLYVTWMRCPGAVFTGNCGGTTATMFLSKSSDGGNTWSAPVTITNVALTPGTSCFYAYGCLPNTFEGLTNIPASAVNGSGATAKVYVVFYNWTGTQMQVEVATSTDGGNSFGAPVRVTNSNSGDEFFPWLSLASDGRLGVTWLDRRNDPSNVSYQPFFAISTDGAKFSPARPLSTTLSNPNNDGSFGAGLGNYRTHVWVGNAIYASWMDTRSGNARVEVGGAEF